MLRSRSPHEQYWLIYSTRHGLLQHMLEEHTEVSSYRIRSYPDSSSHDYDQLRFYALIYCTFEVHLKLYNADQALRMSTPLHLKKVDSHTDLNFELSLVTSSLFIMLSPSAA